MGYFPPKLLEISIQSNNIRARRKNNNRILKLKTYILYEGKIVTTKNKRPITAAEAPNKALLLAISGVI